MKIFIKLFLEYTLYSISFYYYLCYKLLRFDYKELAISISNYSGWKGKMIRRGFYRMTLKKCGRDIIVHYGSFIVYPETEIGQKCAIEEYSIVSLCNIGDDVIIAARCSIMSGSKHHDVTDIHNTFYNSKSVIKKIQLGDNLWIGTHSVIMADISSHTAVAAGSVVTKTFPEYSVIGGVPARIIRDRKI